MSNLNKDINWEKISFGIITTAGYAKSEAMEALYSAKEGNFEQAEKKMNLAEKKIGEASHIHFDVIQKEAEGQKLEFKVLFMHAEDQLLTTQTLIILVKEMIALHLKISKSN